MSRRKIAYEVHRKSETPGKPDHKTIITQKTTLIYDKLVAAGRRGITTRDMPGYDLRHFLRVMRNSGIGIDREWESNADGGQHGRWRLRKGHTHRQVPYPEKTKASTAATVKLSNSNATGKDCEGLNA